MRRFLDTVCLAGAMNLRIMNSLLALALTWWTKAAVGQSDHCSSGPEIVQGQEAARFDGLLRKWETGGFSGVVLVLKREEPVMRRAYGFSNWEQQVRNTVDTPFPVASVTKQFLAAAILRLEMEGRLRVSEPISKYLGKFPGQVGDATIYDLLTHRSGVISSGTSFESSSSDEFVDKLKKAPRESEPGQRYRYSNGGYSLLAAILERVSGKPFDKFMEEHLFQPAGMHCTHFTSNRQTARGYELEESQISATIAPSILHRIFRVKYRPDLRPAKPVSSDWSIRTSGGIALTISDLEKWEQGLRQGSILSKKAQAQLFMPRFPTPTDNQWQAYAWTIEQTTSGGEVAYQYGDYWGYQSAYVRYSDGDWVLFLATNVSVGRGPKGWRPAIRSVFEQIFLAH